MATGTLVGPPPGRSGQIADGRCCPSPSPLLPQPLPLGRLPNARSSWAARAKNLCREEWGGDRPHPAHVSTHVHTHTAAWLRQGVWWRRLPGSLSPGTQQAGSICMGFRSPHTQESPAVAGSPPGQSLPIFLLQRSCAKSLAPPPPPHACVGSLSASDVPGEAQSSTYLGAR